ncbi:MAG TPA: DUF1592 domain-containing protein [Polyangiaceae bacterium]|nr:DUF1592 domain-containing protein [Polyangiaceae bacterium]
MDPRDPMPPIRLFIVSAFSLPACTLSSSASFDNSGQGPDFATPTPAASVRETGFARLNHREYENTVVDLLGLGRGIASGFAPDANRGSRFDTDADLRVDSRLGPQYRIAAEGLAEQLVADDAAFARAVPCEPAEAACSDRFIAEFGLKALRRPLEPQELRRFKQLFERGSELYAGSDAFRDGVRIVVEAMLQTPQFIYRTALSAQPGARLSSWELASKLAYFVHGSMPDPELRELAGRDALQTDEEVRAAVVRMIEAPRALSQFVTFHEQALDVARFARIQPDPAQYPELPGDYSMRVRAATSAFFVTLVEERGGVRELLSAPFAFADAALAPLYGVEWPGAAATRDFSSDTELRRIELPGRAGILMQIGFLAANAHAIATDPIHRGLFVLRDILCREVPDPPPGASQSPLPAGAPPPRTTRESVSTLTAGASCSGCHSQINPVGFAFEQFDAVGRFRELENGVTIDASGSMELDGQPLQFADAGTLVEALANSEEARRCYARHWLEFASGRAISGSDDPAVTAQLDELSQSGLSIRDIALRIAGAAEFAQRAIPVVVPKAEP